MKIEAPFAYGKPVPQKYSCEGLNRSPALELLEVPAGTKSIALIMEDPDAPMGTFIHWVLWNISPGTKEIPEGAKDFATEGAGSLGRVGYRGPCPPPGHGPHRYFFRAFALDAVLELKAHSDKAALEKAMEGHVIEQAETMGTYERR